jgi:hypothetical protein
VLDFSPPLQTLDTGRPGDRQCSQRRGIELFFRWVLVVVHSNFTPQSGQVLRSL